MRKLFIILLVANAFIVNELCAKNTAKQGSVVLSNGTITVEISKMGGAFVSLQKGEKVNPLSWKLTKEQMPVNNRSGAVFQGHFLCTGRWGAPTDGETKAGCLTMALFLSLLKNLM